VRQGQSAPDVRISRNPPADVRIGVEGPKRPHDEGEHVDAILSMTQLRGQRRHISPHARQRAIELVHE
jgi:hypothetical protein